MSHKYVDLGKDGDQVYLYSLNRETNRFTREKQVLWGDWLLVDDDHDYTGVPEGWTAIRWAPKTKNEIYYIRQENTIDERPLEIIFVDVGQGDGAVLITPERGPEEKILVIDAGESANMRRFLNGRFKAYRGFDFEAAIITHPDNDHYAGFEHIFNDHNIGFNTIYQNGLVERPEGGRFEKLGGTVEDPPDSGIHFIEDLAETRADIERLFSDPSTFGRYQFPPLMFAALQNPRIQDFRMLSIDPAHSIHRHGRAYMPGFAPTPGKSYSIEVLGPIVERADDGRPRLRRISSDYGETKNGHSILLRLHMGQYKIFFGGDLNIPAEKYLLQQYTNLDNWPSPGTEEYDHMMTTASRWFRSEIMKVCHHGSEKVTDEFMQVVHPAGFIISSGDREGHVHPRPDLLGRLGRIGRGESPLILSTELQRSSREFEEPEFVQDLQDDIRKLTENPADADLLTSIQEQIEHLGRTNVDVYGAVYVKTDGERLIIAFKYEELSDKKKWFYYEYSIDEEGKLHLLK
jgi:beta-lactamase superfamily II metal-dependent hydrolase